jgi:hypothetical protein
MEIWVSHQHLIKIPSLLTFYVVSDVTEENTTTILVQEETVFDQKFNCYIHKIPQLVSKLTVTYLAHTVTYHFNIINPSGFRCPKLIPHRRIYY